MSTIKATAAQLRAQYEENDPAFWGNFCRAISVSSDIGEWIALSQLKKRALKSARLPLPIQRQCKIAVLGAYTFHPLIEIFDLLLFAQGIQAKFHLGEYDNYVAEILASDGALYQFKPELVYVFPSSKRCRFSGTPLASQEEVGREASAQAAHLIHLAEKIQASTQAEVILSNFILPLNYEPGNYRSRMPTSDWSFRKLVNMELGKQTPAGLCLCDLEFLSARLGLEHSNDPRAWYESKQMGSPEFIIEVAKELSFLSEHVKGATKKVLVLDLDNSLWGGTVGDDGIDGIELGENTPRGEAFRDFQKYVLNLKHRGVLLAICSKNDEVTAKDVFRTHPDMVLKLEDIVSFKANWEPKSNNIRAIANELGLGLESIVFADDNPAEIEIVRQILPEVSLVLLGQDPSEFCHKLDELRLFEPSTLTAEDYQRTKSYQGKEAATALMVSATDLDSYLKSLQMRISIQPFQTIDVPRLSQLINKSNQFNLTTRRRTESEVKFLMSMPEYVTLSARLTDRFTEHGLISIVIAKKMGDCLEVDTWLMSCRVLQRQVEQEMLNALVRLAKAKHCTRLIGRYYPTSKNTMVSQFYLKMGFTPVQESEQMKEYEMGINHFSMLKTNINLEPATDGYRNESGESELGL